MKLEIEVGEKSVAFVEGFSDFIKVANQVLKDGFQPGSDLPAIATSALSDLLPIIGDLQVVKDEIDSMPASRAILAALLFNEMLDIFDDD